MKKLLALILTAVMLGGLTAAQAADGDGYRKFYTHTSASSTTNYTDIQNAYNPRYADPEFAQQEIQALTVVGTANGTNDLLCVLSRITKGVTVSLGTVTIAAGSSQSATNFTPSVVLGTNDTFRITTTDLAGGQQILTNGVTYETLQQ